MKKIILLILLTLILPSCTEVKERNLLGKVVTRKDSIIVVGEDTLTRSERLKYNIYSLRVGDTLKYEY